MISLPRSSKGTFNAMGAGGEQGNKENGLGYGKRVCSISTASWGLISCSLFGMLPRQRMSASLVSLLFIRDTREQIG